MHWRRSIARAAAWKKIRSETARWLAAAAAGGNLDAEVEYAIVLFNGNGVAKDEGGAAANFPEVGAARKSDLAKSPGAYPFSRARLAGRSGAGGQWHMVAKAAAMATSYSMILSPS